jgi:opacity protein-like surface antigen
MNKNAQAWLLPFAGTLLLATAATKPPAPPPQLERDVLDSTNRITGSIRFGMNIRGKFSNPGGSLNPNYNGLGNRRAPGGKLFNYDDGYVLTDISHNFGGMTWFWGYVNPGQINASGPNTIDFHHVTAPALPGEIPAGDSPYMGAEITYDRELGVKEDWHHLRYGIEAAVNFMPFDMDYANGINTRLATKTDTYAYTPGTTPPGAPYYGSYRGPGFLLGSSPVNSFTTLSPGNYNLQGHYDLNAYLWGFRLGPYLESPLTKKLSLHVSAGLSVAFLDSTCRWSEMLTPPGGGTPAFNSGGGGFSKWMAGYYVSADATYQINKRWGLDLGVQYQDVGRFSHNFGGRSAELDLSKSVFVQLGVSYSF